MSAIGQKRKFLDVRFTPKADGSGGATVATAQNGPPTGAYLPVRWRPNLYYSYYAYYGPPCYGRFYNLAPYYFPGDYQALQLIDTGPAGAGATSWRPDCGRNKSDSLAIFAAIRRVLPIASLRLRWRPECEPKSKREW
jgi:hypothetical protein